MKKALCTTFLLCLFLVLQTAIVRAAVIYRSNAPGNTSAVSVSLGNSLTVNSGIAVFTMGVPSTVGVGMVIQYDANDDSSVDSLAFITARLDAQTFAVQAANGSLPPNTVALDDNWTIFHAYTSLFNAISANENTGIDATLRNFDPWIGGRDLVVNNEVWMIACYEGEDTSAVLISGWNTGPDHFLKIYTPYTSNEVGISQRHNGTYTPSAYRLTTSGATGIYCTINHAHFEGLQFQVPTVSTFGLKHLRIANLGSGSEFFISHNIFAGTPTTQDTHGGVSVFGAGDGVVYVWNNIFYDFQVLAANWMAALDIDDSGFIAYAMNNTFYNCYIGLYRGNGTVQAVNNLAQACSDGFQGVFDPGSGYNLSDIPSDPPGSNTRVATVTFVNVGTRDLHLSLSDTGAQGFGLDLSSTGARPFTDDIDNEWRDTPWDIGADQLPALYTPTPTIVVGTFTQTPTFTPTPTISPTFTNTSTPTPTIDILVVQSPTPTVTQEDTPTPSPTYTPSPTITPVMGEIRIRNNIIRSGGNQAVSIDIPVPQTQSLYARIYNQRGKLVKILWDTSADQGLLQLTWNGDDASGQAVRSGIYILTIKSQQFDLKQKLAVIR